MKNTKVIINTTLAVCIIFFCFISSKTIVAGDNSNTKSSIHVTTIEEGGNTVKGNPLITAIPESNKEVQQISFFAKAVNEPESAFYPYAPLTNEPYSWNWPTGDPWVPDGEYILKMEIEYSSDDIEVVTRNVIVDNYGTPNAPMSPNDLKIISDSNAGVELIWSPSESNNIYIYEIYQDGKKIGETTDTFFIIDKLLPNTFYNFRVKSVDVYNNESFDDNSIVILTNEEHGLITPLPKISEIQLPEPNGVSPRSEGYSGVIELSVFSELDDVDFAIKPYNSPDEDYWSFPQTSSVDNVHTVSWDTTSAPDGKVIIKAVATDEHNQKSTVSVELLVDNEIEGYIPPDWEYAAVPPENYIIGYLAGWATLGNYDIINDVDASRLTHINYAFGLIGDDLKIKMSDPIQDPINFADLTMLKEKFPHLKTTIAIGGWGGSANFSEAAATQESRLTFANSVVDFIVEHDFNGVDLDWEYPVTGGGPGTYPNPDDYDNFPLLLETVREKLDEQGEKDGVHYSLSIAGAANTSFIENTQIGTTQNLLDYVQIMTYDIHGTWEDLADLNAPLYDDYGKTWSVDKAVQAYLDAGVPAEKVVMGVPFYGYSYNVLSGENNGFRQEYNGSGSVTYNQIVQNNYLNNGYIRFWDEGTAVPYLFNQEEAIFISYDDEESMTIKANYIREQGLGGAMIWEISQDHSNDLLNSLYGVLKEPIDHPQDNGDDDDKDKEPEGNDKGEDPKDSEDPGDQEKPVIPGEENNEVEDPNKDNDADDQTKDVDNSIGENENSNNNETLSPTNDENDDLNSDKDQADKTGKKLPKTATSLYNLLLIGVLLLIVGSTLVIWKYRQLQ